MCFVPNMADLTRVGQGCHQAVEANKAELVTNKLLPPHFFFGFPFELGSNRVWP